MQPIVKTMLLCDYALTSDDGRLSVMGIFGQIDLPTLPEAKPRFFVVAILTLDAGMHPIRLGILDPAGQQMLPGQPAVDLEIEIPGGDTNLRFDFNNLRFERAGIHQVQLFLHGRLVHSVPLTVQAVAPTGVAPIRAN